VGLLLTVNNFQLTASFGAGSVFPYAQTPPSKAFKKFEKIETDSQEGADLKEHNP